MINCVILYSYKRIRPIHVMLYSVSNPRHLFSQLHERKDIFMFYQSYPCVKRSTISNLDTFGKKIEEILAIERNVILPISFSRCWTSYKLECAGTIGKCNELLPSNLVT